MGFKAVDLQVAIHRTGEAGHLQNQLLQKPIHDQTMSAEAAARHMEDLRKKSEATSKTDEDVNIKREGGRQGGASPEGEASRQGKNDDHDHVEHPYKGHHIDLSL